MINKEKIYENSFGVINKCSHYPEMRRNVILCMIIAEEQFKQDLKNKIKDSINVLLDLDIDEISKQGGISALNLVLKECEPTYYNKL